LLTLIVLLCVAPTSSSLARDQGRAATGAPAVERILHALPAWLGSEEAIQNYARAAAELPNYVALEAGKVIETALVQRHTPDSAGRHLIAVEPDARHKGVGTSLVDTIERGLSADGVRLHEVKTVGPSFDHGVTVRFDVPPAHICDAWISIGASLASTGSRPPGSIGRS